MWNDAADEARWDILHRLSHTQGLGMEWQGRYAVLVLRCWGGVCGVVGMACREP